MASLVLSNVIFCCFSFVFSEIPSHMKVVTTSIWGVAFVRSTRTTSLGFFNSFLKLLNSIAISGCQVISRTKYFQAFSISAKEQHRLFES